MEARARRTVKIRTGSDFPAEPSSGGSSLNHFLQNGDSGTSAGLREVLLQICRRDESSSAVLGKPPHVSSILNVISKQLETKGSVKGLGVDLHDLFVCLRITLLNENKSVRASGLRVIRLCIKDRDSVQVFLSTHLHHFVAKCFDVLMDNMPERAQALRLCRRLLMVEPSLFPEALARSIVALALDGGKEKDRLVRASLALLTELCVVNPSIFIASGGIRCVCSAILDCPSGRMQEAMIAGLLYLLDGPDRRSASGLNLRFLVAPYSDFHYKHYGDAAVGGAPLDAAGGGLGNNPATGSGAADRELRLLCAKQALLSVLHSWGGLLHLVSCRILDDLVRVLLPCHLETRKAMLEFFYTLLRLPLPDWTDEFSVALVATDPSRIRDSWRLADGFVAAEGKSILPHVSKGRPNLVLNHTALLVYCLLEAQLLPTLVEVIVSSDTFISVRATILLGELLHLAGTLLPPACHGTKVCLPKLVDYATSLPSPTSPGWEGDEPIRRHRAGQAASALSKIHRLKKKGVVPRSLALRQILELEHRWAAVVGHASGKQGSHPPAQQNGTDREQPASSVMPQRGDPPPGNHVEVDPEMRSNRDPDGVLYSLVRDCGVLSGHQRDPLLWNWPVLADLFEWSRLHSMALDECSSIRSIVRRVLHFYKPTSNQFCQCESSTSYSSASSASNAAGSSVVGSSRTRLFSTVGCYLMDFLTAVEEPECEKILSDFLDDVSSAIREITSASSAHDCLLSPGRLASTACADYFLFIGRLSGSLNGINALERAGIFQDLLELVASTHHDCYLKLIVSTLDYHTDGYSRAILKKVLVGNVESGRIYATHQMRVLVRAAAQAGSIAALAKWAVPLLIEQLKDKCRAVVVAATDVLDEATDDSVFIEELLPLHSQLVQLVRKQESELLDASQRLALLIVKLLSVPAGFKLWSEQEVAVDAESATAVDGQMGLQEESGMKGKKSLVQLELDKWIDHLNTRYAQLVESDLADGLTQHQRADDGRYGRLSNARHVVRDLPVPPHLFSQLARHRDGLDFLRTSGQLCKIFSTVTDGAAAAASETYDEEKVLELKAAIWASAHLGTSEAGAAVLESAQVVEALARLAGVSPILAVRGTAFSALNLIAMTPTGVHFLSRLGWASIKRHHGELWHVIDETEWSCLLDPLTAGGGPLVSSAHPLCNGLEEGTVNGYALLTEQSVGSLPTSSVQHQRLRTVSQSSGHSVTFATCGADGKAAANGRGTDASASALLVTSTPRRTTSCSGTTGQPTCWETDSQPYSLEGSSVHFDSDTEDDGSSIAIASAAEMEDAGDREPGREQRVCRRAYTLPPSSTQPVSASSQGRGGSSGMVHVRSFSDSHYPSAGDEVVDSLGPVPLSGLFSGGGGGGGGGGSSGVDVSATEKSSRMRIWTRLRTSLRLRKSKRLSLPAGSPTATSPPPPTLCVTPPSDRNANMDKAGSPSSCSSFEGGVKLSSSVEGETNASGNEEEDGIRADRGDNDDDDDCEETESPPPLPFQSQQLDRIGSILSRIKAVPFKQKRPGLTLPGSSSFSCSSSSSCNPSASCAGTECSTYVGLCLPVRLSYLHPPSSWFDPPPRLPPPPPPPPPTSEESDLSVGNSTINCPDSTPFDEEVQFDHQTDSCILCSSGSTPSIRASSNQTAEERHLVRKELLRLVGNMGSSVGLNANEQGLLRLKQRFPWAFHDVCLFSDVCGILAGYGYRLRARRFLHELFMDSPFDELYADAAARLSRPDRQDPLPEEPERPVQVEEPGNTT